MFHVRVASHADSTEEILELLGTSTGAVNVSVLTGSARFPDGDMIECDLVPEVANEVIHQLRDLGPRQTRSDHRRPIGYCRRAHPPRDDQTDGQRS